MSDERPLIEGAQKDPSRFAELYEENFERVYAYVIRRVRGPVDVNWATVNSVELTEKAPVSGRELPSADRHP